MAVLTVNWPILLSGVEGSTIRPSEKGASSDTFHRPRSYTHWMDGPEDLSFTFIVGEQYERADCHCCDTPFL